MKISFLMQDVGITAGNIAIYTHAENLTKFGHEVYIILPKYSFKWKMGLDKEIFKKVLIKAKNQSKIRKLILIVDNKLFNNLIEKKYCSRNFIYHKDNSVYKFIEKITNALIKNWIETDITIATFWTTSFAASLLSEKTTPIYYIQHYEELFYTNKEEKTRLICRMSYGLPIHFITTSLWLKNQIKSRFERDSELINYALRNSEIFNNNVKSIDKKFTDTSYIKIISYCNSRLFKGWKYTIEAIKIVKKRYPNTIFRTFGEMIDEKDINVEHLGYLNEKELAHYMRDSHIGFSASLYESFPWPPLEMMACGCATITTRDGTEDYAIDNFNCLIINSKDPMDLANKIIYLIENIEVAKKIAKNALETHKKFSWEKSSIDFENFLKNSLFKNKFKDIKEYLPI